MKKIIPIILIFGLILSACTEGIKGEGDANGSVDFKIEPFDAIDANGSFKLVLIPFDSSYVSVQSHENLIQNMDIYVQNKTLHLGEKTPVERFESYVVYMYFNGNLNEISTAGKVLLETEGIIEIDDFELTTKDASNVNQFGLIAKEAKMSALDKSEVTINGEVSKLNLKSKDYAKVNLEDFKVKVLDVDLAGEADVQVDVSKELTGRVLQNANLTYDGNPTKDVEVKDNGEIIKN